MAELDFNGVAPDGVAPYIDRELSWLAFARRVVALAEDRELPLLERVKFAGIVGMLHDEFFMKRVSGMKERVREGSSRSSPGGLSAQEQLAAGREEILSQMEVVAHVLEREIRPALAEEGLAILDYEALPKGDRETLRDYCRRSVLPILTPLAVDAGHPFPFISNDALNIGAWLPVEQTGRERFVRIKVPENRPRWLVAPSGGFVPLEQVIAANLDMLFPGTPPVHTLFFRVTRSAKGYLDADAELYQQSTREPGSIIQQVSSQLKARRFAGVVRLVVADTSPLEGIQWIARQLGTEASDVYVSDTLLRLSDLLQFDHRDRSDLYPPAHDPVNHPRLQNVTQKNGNIFDEIARGDILLHHPYHSFDSSVLRFIEAASIDPDVLAMKLTIYRTSEDSPIVQALARAARGGKQVAVLVEITARFDEAPNIAWGKSLENEGVHVSYGVEKLKTHVKAALVVREEGGGVRRYAHIGTGNYHTGTARIYEDLGVLTCHPEICEDVAKLFNELTGASEGATYEHMLVAPVSMRRRFTEMIRREAEHARAGRACGIRAKMNQLQDDLLIEELYRASQAGVPVELNVRGLCCLRPGVEGMSQNIRVFGLVGRFLEHGRIYRFENDGEPEYYIGSADWMTRNLDRRVESIMPVLDRAVQAELDVIFETYTRDNSSVWDCQPDGAYLRRRPADGEAPCAAQEAFIEAAGRPLHPDEVADPEEPAQPEGESDPADRELAKRR